MENTKRQAKNRTNNITVRFHAETKQSVVREQGNVKRKPTVRMRLVCNVGVCGVLHVCASVGVWVGVCLRVFRCLNNTLTYIQI